MAIVELGMFKPRKYQVGPMDAIENKGYRNVVVVAPRRAGKDLMAWNLIIRQALRKVAVYFYVLPTFEQARRVIWDSITVDSVRFLDFIPKKLVLKRNSHKMKIELINGSIIQLVGSDRIENLLGTNPYGIVFSEYAVQDPRIYERLSPILANNGGWSMMISTPRGYNNFYDLYELAKKEPDWYCQFLTVDDTGHMTQEALDAERRKFSEEWIQQEYYCSWAMGVEGAYYARYIDKLKLLGKIGRVPWMSDLEVHTAWDLGIADSTSIIFFQVKNNAIYIIDAYQNNKEGLEHYVDVIKSKPYNYGVHIAPWDLTIREWSTGITRLEKAASLGLDFEVADKLKVEDGIEAVRSKLSAMYMDEENAAELIKCLENYSQQFDHKLKRYKNKPLHNWASHYADAMRTLCTSLHYIERATTSEDIDKYYNEARYGSQGNLPHFFR